MDRKRKIRGIVLISATIGLLTAYGCTRHEITTGKDVTIMVSCDRLKSKAYNPEENLVTDISLIIFDESGTAEELLWSRSGVTVFNVKLVTGKQYTICACANFGYRIYADDIAELEDMRYHMAYPDEYRNGIPMYAMEEVFIDEDDSEISISLKRLMAKISLQIDRSMLSEDVSMYVRSAKIGNCPRSTAIFTGNKVRDEDDCFPVGFTRRNIETDGLNSTSPDGLSEEISLYMLENMQGNIDISDDTEKVFDEDDSRRQTCSYIEMEIEYASDEFYSTGKGLIYRFYLGEDRNSLNIERNCHYHITVTPEDDGLSDDGWRVDKRYLSDYGPVSFQAYPSDYIVGDIGDEIHIWCEFSPRNAPFDVGMTYMEDDKAQGIYDYVIDEDGYGATLTLTGPGRGLIYMEAGEPVNETALFIIEVNLPEI
ncbi:MAG: DUF4906 domain-containing protein [Bacteroidales bacterium]|nr:DUF4906 domain-containing protein [Bacteroidales bacterium]